MLSRKSVGHALVGALLVGAFAACGPVEYIGQVTRRASGEVAAAKAVAAPADPQYQYWYTLASEYLLRARYEAAHADYQAANRFGKLAETAARRAKERGLAKAAGDSQDGSSSPEEAE